MSLFNGIKWPYATMQQLNLDWILTEIKRVLGFFPEDGNPGTVLMKTDDGAAWEELPAIDLNINGVPEDTELTDTDKLIFYDVSSSANRKITAPNLLNSMMSNGTPLMDGTASAGTSKKPARYDHRHPTDTTRAPASYFKNNALKVENGGTGASTAADARANLGLAYSEVHDTAATSEVTAINKNYTVHGSGFVIASCSIISDSASDVGFSLSEILKNNAIMAEMVGSLDFARSYQNGACASAAFIVSNGDTITMQTRCTKNGSKTVYYDILCVGCTVT